MKSIECEGITVGIPVLNPGQDVLTSVAMALNQSWPGELQVLIYDDGSDAKNKNQLRELPNRYANLRIIEAERNAGRPHARNRILEEVQTKYLAWMDAGDYWHPQKLERQMELLSSFESAANTVIATCPFWIYMVEQGRYRKYVPDLEGDQLRGLIERRVSPYLWTMLGHIDAFRSIGNFDHRLLRRQDFDFILRFLASGGRLIRPRGSPPLCTYVRARKGRSASHVRRANGVIWRKHKAVYRRYGLTFANAARRSQHSLAQEFFRENGHHFSAAIEGARARFRGYFAGSREGSKKAPREHALVEHQKTTWNGSRFNGEVLPVQDLGEERSRNQEIDQVMQSARKWLKRAKKNEREVGVIGGISILESAPNEVKRVQDVAEFMANRLSKLGRHLDAVYCWESAKCDPHRTKSKWTLIRVARSYKECGDYEKGFKIISIARNRERNDAAVDKEFYSLRRLRVKWSASILPLHEVNVGSEVVKIRVERQGFTTGEECAFDALLGNDQREAHQVELMVNECRVAITRALDVSDGLARFSINCRDALGYLGDGDVLRVYVGGKVAVDEEGVTARVVNTGCRSHWAVLKNKLEAGYVFTKFGELRRPMDAADVERALEFVTELKGFINVETHFVVYPYYGNLLGIVREGQVIRHDVGAFDILFCFDSSDPLVVRRQFVRLITAIAEKGYRVKMSPWGALVWSGGNSSVLVDINFGWVSERQGVRPSYGWRYHNIVDRTDFFRSEAGSCNGVAVEIPANAEMVMEQLYGPTWPLPDQGFDPGRELIRDWEYLLAADDLRDLASRKTLNVEIKWSEFPASEFSGNDSRWRESRNRHAESGPDNAANNASSRVRFALDDRIEQPGETKLATLVRVIGNDLYPRHERGQQRENLRFILENEPHLPRCEKKWIVNRIVDGREREAILALLKAHAAAYVEIPFSRQEYMKVCWHLESFPSAGYFCTEAFARLGKGKKEWAYLTAYKNKINYIMNNNGARNRAIAERDSNAEWVLPFDGNVFFLQRSWRDLQSHLERGGDHKYVVVPMARALNNSDVLVEGQSFEATEEPQIAFRKDSLERFNESVPYGRRPKVDMLWRLQVPGPWDEWTTYSWDVAPHRCTGEEGKYDVAGWCVRLASGNSATDGTGIEALKCRSAARKLAVRETVHHVKRICHQIPERDTLQLSSRAYSRVLDLIDGGSGGDATIQGHGEVSPASLVDRAGRLGAPCTLSWGIAAEGVEALMTELNAMALQHHIRRDCGERKNVGVEALAPAERDGESDFVLIAFACLRLSERHCGTVCSVLRRGLSIFFAWNKGGLDASASEMVTEYKRDLFRKVVDECEVHVSPEPSDVNRARVVWEEMFQCKLVPFFVDALRVLEGCGGFTDGECERIHRWLDRYVEWLTSPGVMAEKGSRTDGTGVWYEVEIASVGCFLGSERQVYQAVIHAKSRACLEFLTCGMHVGSAGEPHSKGEICETMFGWCVLHRILRRYGEGIITSAEEEDGKRLRAGFRWMCVVLAQPGEQVPPEANVQDGLISALISVASSQGAIPEVMARVCVRSLSGSVKCLNTSDGKVSVNHLGMSGGSIS